MVRTGTRYGKPVPNSLTQLDLKMAAAKFSATRFAFGRAFRCKMATMSELLRRRHSPSPQNQNAVRRDEEGNFNAQESAKPENRVSGLALRRGHGQAALSSVTSSCALRACEKEPWNISA